jgi:DNA polymerase III sliding clamp (beta) subunit (PCNA family)
LKINKKELINILDKVKPGLSTKELIENTNKFYFTGKEVITFNDEICTRVPYETDFVGTVNAQKFFDLLNKIQTPEIDLTFDEKEIKVQAKKAKAGITLDPDGVLPIEELGELPNPKEFKSIPKNFVDGIFMSSFCVSTDSSNPILSCLYIDGKSIMSSDSYKVFKYELNKKMKSFLLPAFNIQSIKKYNINKYALTDAWIHFKTTENFILSIRIYPSTEYPDIKELFDGVQGDSFSFPDTTQNILDKAIIFCDGAFDIDTVLNVQIKGKKLTVSSKSDDGWFKESTVSKTKLDYLQFDVNPNFLKQILKLGNDCIIDKEQKRVLFKGDDWKYLFSVDVK